MLFHRFYMKQSFGEHDRFEVATCCLFLACKVEETPKKIQAVILTCHAVKVENKARVAAAAAASQSSSSSSSSYSSSSSSSSSLSSSSLSSPSSSPSSSSVGAPAPPSRPRADLDPKGDEFLKLRDRVLLLERVLLHTLSFDLSVEHPYKYLIEEMNKLRIKGLEKDTSSCVQPPSGSGSSNFSSSYSSSSSSLSLQKAFANDLGHRALNLLNDSYHTILCLRFPPRVLALSCLLVAARALKVGPAGTGSWSDLVSPAATEAVGKAVDIVAAEIVDRGGTTQSKMTTTTTTTNNKAETKTTKTANTRTTDTHMGGGDHKRVRTESK